MKKGFIIIVLCISIFYCHSGIVTGEVLDEKTQSFQKANALYKTGDYSAALDIFKKLAVTDYLNNADLYYNIGNCYFKTGDLARAIASYRRAQVYAPHDAYIAKNLQYVRSLVEFKDDDQRPSYVRLMDKIQSRITLSDAIIFILVCTLLLILMIACAIFFGFKGLIKFMIVILVMLIIGGVCLGSIEYYWNVSYLEAVIIHTDVAVLHGPSQNENIAFRLVNGIEVSVDEIKDEWCRIRLKSGKVGWVQKQAIEVI